MRILSRIVVWAAAGIQHEGDERHLEIAMEKLGLEEESQEVGVPMAKEDDHRASEIELNSSAARQYRGIVARIHYPGRDRSQIQVAFEGMSGGMAKPSEKDRGRSKKLARFL